MSTYLILASWTQPKILAKPTPFTPACVWLFGAVCHSLGSIDRLRWCTCVSRRERAHARGGGDAHTTRVHIEDAPPTTEVSMWESRPHSRAMARDMTVVDAPVSTQARRRLGVLFFWWWFWVSWGVGGLVWVGRRLLPLTYDESPRSPPHPKTNTDT